MKLLLGLVIACLPLIAQADDQLWVATGVAGGDNVQSGKAKHVSYATLANEAWQLPNLDLSEEKKREVTGKFNEEFRFKNGYTVNVSSLDQTPTRYIVRLQVKDSAGALLTLDAKLAKGAPVILRGPAAAGQSPVLIIEFR